MKDPIFRLPVTCTAHFTTFCVSLNNKSLIFKKYYLKLKPKKAKIKTKHIYKTTKKPNNPIQKWEKEGTSLVVKWLRICLPMQGTRVRALVREDPTCHGATKPVHHNDWACALEPASHNYRARVLQLLKSVRLEPVFRNKRSHRNEKPVHRNKE